MTLPDATRLVEQLQAAIKALSHIEAIALHSVYGSSGYAWGQRSDIEAAAKKVRNLIELLAAQPEPTDPLQGLRDAKYLNPVCASDGCQWLRAAPTPSAWQPQETIEQACERLVKQLMPHRRQGETLLETFMRFLPAKPPADADKEP